jgi:hypothetical protein
MTAQQMYDKYLAAELKILEGQEVRFGERSLTRADLAEIRRGRIEWERKLIGKSHSLASFS